MRFIFWTNGPPRDHYVWSNLASSYNGLVQALDSCAGHPIVRGLFTFMPARESFDPSASHRVASMVIRSMQRWRD